jgi:DNA-binding transcriptional regulator YhcF (GntR family)
MQIHIDRSSFLPPYRQIKDQIKDLISNGELKENQLFGSVRKVAEMAGVSVATVQKTLNELKQENLVYSKPGDGYYVSKQMSISDTVFIILPSSRLSFFTYILEGMYEANQNIGLSLQVFSLKTDKLAWDTHTIELLKTARRDKCSVIFIEEAWDQVREECLRTAKKVPFLTIEWILENAINIVNDYKVAGHSMVEYLVKKRNAKGILVLKGRVNQFNARERLIGMQEAAR